MLGLIRRGLAALWGNTAVAARETPYFPEATRLFFLSPRLLASDLTANLTQPYREHVWVYACVNAIAQNISGVPLLFKTGTRKDSQVLESHPLIDLFETPNPLMSWSQLIEATLIYLGLTGEAFYIMDRQSEKEIPKELWVVHPDRFKEVVDEKSGLISGWIYSKGTRQIPLQPHEVVFFRYFNPYNDYRGLAPLQAARAGIEQDFWASQYNTAFFKNSAQPGGVLETSGNLTDEEYQRLLAQWQDRHGGAPKAHAIALLEGGVSYKQTGLSQKDMDFLEQRKWNREEIMAAFKVPKGELGLYEDVNYACIPATERVYTVNRGPVPIKDIKPGELVWSYSENGPEAKKVVNVWEQGEKPIFRVRLRDRDIRASGDHPLLTFAKIKEGRKYNKSFVWKRADELKEGDFVVCPRNLPLPGLSNESEEFAQIAGLFLGDGSIPRNNGKCKYVTFGLHSGDVWRDKYVALCEKVFEYSRNFADERPLKVCILEKSLSIGSTSAVEKVREAGLDKHSLERRIPEWVWQLDRARALKFLRGYVDTDGHVSLDGRITFATPNLGLIEDLKSLCHYLGIRTSNINYSKCYPRFGDQQYNATLFRLALTDPVANREIWSENPINQERLKTDRRYRATYEYKSERHNCHPGFMLSKVKSVEFEGLDKTYDLEVEERHNFICEGIVVHNTAKTQRKLFWENTLLPKMALFEFVLWSQLLRRIEGGRNWAEFDYSSISALHEDRNELMDSAQKLWSMGVPLNTVNEYLGLGLPQVEGGDVGYLPFNLAPVTHVAPPIEPAKELIAHAADSSPSLLLAAPFFSHRFDSEAYWKAYLAVHTPLEKTVQSKISRYFYEQRKRQLRKMEEALGKAVTRELTVESLLLDSDEENAVLRKMIWPLYLEIGQKAGESLFAELGADPGIFTLVDTPAMAALKNKLIKVVGINDTVRAQLRDTLIEGMGKMENTAELMDRVKQVYNFAQSRSLTIARTETGQAMGIARDAAMDQMKVEKIQWVTAGDEHVRESHQMLNGMVMERGQVFPNGCLYPCDVNGPPEETINCRCVASPLVESTTTG